MKTVPGDVPGDAIHPSERRDEREEKSPEKRGPPTRYSSTAQAAGYVSNLQGLPSCRGWRAEVDGRDGWMDGCRTKPLAVSVEGGGMAGLVEGRPGCERGGHCGGREETKGEKGEGAQPDGGTKGGGRDKHQ